MSNKNIRIGDCVDILFVSLNSSNRYVIWSMTSNIIKLYYIDDYEDQLTLNYIDNKWSILYSTDEIKISFVGNYLLDKVDVSQTRLIDMIKLFPSKRWDYGWLSMNPNIIFSSH